MPKDKSYSPDSQQFNPGYVHDVSSPITGGTQYVPTGGVNNPRLSTQEHQRMAQAEATAKYEAAAKYQGETRPRNGSPIFYALLEKMALTHDRKSHDYASDENPFGNYHFAGMMSQLFENPDDAGFVGRIGEKLFRLANLENGLKNPRNESVEDTEIDLCTIMTLWVADRRTRRMNATKISQPTLTEQGKQEYLRGKELDASR